ncbi:MAG TPA: hypothetical protein VFA26_22535, partial [Gemmataceae bacterium]|nr:hypothetical protein [Gemmataceae bacterium]
MSHTPADPRFPRWFARLLLPVLLLTGVAWLAAELAAQPPVKRRPPVVEEEEDKDAPKKKRVAPAEQKGKKGGPIAEERDDKPAKKKRIEVEEEEKGGRPKRKVIPVDEGDTPAKTPKPPKPPPKPPVVEGPETDLAQAAKQARNPEVRRLFRDLAFAHDIVTYKPVNVHEERTERVEPLAQYFPPDARPTFTGTLSVETLDQNGKRSGRYGLLKNMVISIRPYEEHAQKRVDDFLNTRLENAADPSLRLTRMEMLAVAQRVLKFVLGEHASLRQRGLRDGPDWDKVEEELKKKLFDLKVRQLDLLAEADDWSAAADLAREIAEEYPDLPPGDKVRVGKPLFELARRSLARGGFDAEKLREVQLRLKLLQDQFPNDPGARELAGSLRQQAQSLFEQARDLMAKKDRTQAKQRLLQARALYPALPGLEDYYLQQEAEYPELVVGVRELPVFMAPGLAQTESERAAVDLLFEGLVKASYDPAAGQRYEPALAEGRPRLAPLGRQFRISRQALWAD